MRTPRPMPRQGCMYGSALPFQTMPRHPNWVPEPITEGRSLQGRFCPHARVRDGRRRGASGFAVLSPHARQGIHSQGADRERQGFPGRLDRIANGVGVGEGCEEEVIGRLRRQGRMGATTHRRVQACDGQSTGNGAMGRPEQGGRFEPQCLVMPGCETNMTSRRRGDVCADTTLGGVTQQHLDGCHGPSGRPVHIRDPKSERRTQLSAIDISRADFNASTDGSDHLSGSFSVEFPNSFTGWLRVVCGTA